MTSPGKQLDSMVARTVWGYVVIIDTQSGAHYIMGKDRQAQDVPNFSTELATSYEVVNQMQKHGFSFQLKNLVEQGVTKWITCFTKSDNRRYTPSIAPELPQAICIAAIAAIRGENIYTG